MVAKARLAMDHGLNKCGRIARKSYGLQIKEDVSCSEDQMIVFIELR